MAESDLKAPRELNPGIPRGRYHAPYFSVREQMPTAAGEESRTASLLPSMRPPAHHADVAQARQFIELLRTEHAELAAAAAMGACRRAGRCTVQMRRLQADMNEIRQLLEALEKRFPSS